MKKTTKYCDARSFRPDREILPFLDAVEESGYPLARLVNEALKLYSEQILQEKMGKLVKAAASLRAAAVASSCTTSNFSDGEKAVLEQLKTEHIAAQSAPTKRAVSVQKLKPQ